MNEIIQVLLSASIAYIALFIIAKILGKKQIAELDFIDYVTGISIGSIAAEMSFTTDLPFYYFLIAMGIFMLFDLIVTLLGRKSNFLKSFLRGRPIVLISQGELDFHALRKSKIDIYDLLGLARDKGYFDLKEIEYAIFETNGDLSILAKDDYRNLKKEDFKEIPPKSATLTHYIIVDKIISKHALRETRKSYSWVLSELKNQDTKLKDVMYATLNEETDSLTITKFKKK